MKRIISKAAIIARPPLSLAWRRPGASSRA